MELTIRTANQEQQNDKLVFSALRKRCHCEERSDVAIPRLEGKCSELHHE